jgi:guanylate kinase
LNGAILILSGPSGAGKSTIIQEAKDYIGDFYFSVSTTTRAPRAGEKDGVHYHFVDKKSFEKGILKGEFLEYAKVHDNYYGTSLKPVKEALKLGKLVIFDIDVQGHRLAREKLNNYITSAFITPPSLEELQRRLQNRSTDSKEIIKRRIQNAKEEIKAISEYDYLIINDNLQRATKEFIAVANAARLKSSVYNLEEFLLQWFGEKSPRD